MESGRKLGARNQIGTESIMASAPSSQFKNALMGATIMIIRVGTVNNPVNISQSWFWKLLREITL
jgi:hypothetical protein